MSAWPAVCTILMVSIVLRLVCLDKSIRKGKKKEIRGRVLIRFVSGVLVVQVEGKKKEKCGECSHGVGERNRDRRGTRESGAVRKDKGLIRGRNNSESEKCRNFGKISK